MVKFTFCLSVISPEVTISILESSKRHANTNNIKMMKIIQLRSTTEEPRLSLSRRAITDKNNLLVRYPRSTSVCGHVQLLLNCPGKVLANLTEDNSFEEARAKNPGSRLKGLGADFGYYTQSYCYLNQSEPHFVLLASYKFKNF